mgnify:CR=1 FL=1
MICATINRDYYKQIDHYNLGTLAKQLLVFDILNLKIIPKSKFKPFQLFIKIHWRNIYFYLSSWKRANFPSFLSRSNSSFQHYHAFPFNLKWGFQLFLWSLSARFLVSLSYISLRRFFIRRKPAGYGNLEPALKFNCINKDFLKHFSIKLTVKSFPKISQRFDSATVVK